MIKKRILVAGLTLSTAFGASFTGLFPVMAEEIKIDFLDQEIQINEIMTESDNFNFGGKFFEKLQNLEKLRMLTKSNVESLQTFLGLTETELVTKLENNMTLEEIAVKENISQVDLLDFISNSISDTTNQIYNLGFINSELQDYAASNSKEIAKVIVTTKPSELKNLNGHEGMIADQVLNSTGIHEIENSIVDTVDIEENFRSNNSKDINLFDNFIEDLNLKVNGDPDSSVIISDEVNSENDSSLFGRFWDFVEGLF